MFKLWSINRSYLKKKKKNINKRKFVQKEKKFEKRLISRFPYLHLILNSGAKITIAALSAIGLYKGIAFFRKIAKIKDNITISGKPTAFSFKDLLTVKTPIAATLTNYSGFTLNANNVYSKLFLVNSTGERTETGQSQLIPKINFANNQSKVFELDFYLAYLTIAGHVVTGKIKNFELTTYYEYLGQSYQYTTEIPYAEFVKKAKDFISGNKSVSGAGVGML